MGIAYCECVFVALDIQHAIHMRHTIILWPASLYVIFPHYITNSKISLKKKTLTEHKMCVSDFLYNFCLKHFSF